jgi:hypothetical protein
MNEATDFKSVVSTNFTIEAHAQIIALVLPHFWSRATSLPLDYLLYG